jgi:hypothetical protein
MPMATEHSALTKPCTKCGETKPLLAFNANPSKGDGRHTYCRVCKRAADRARRLENTAAMTEKGRARYAADPDRYRATQRASYIRHKEKRCAASSEWAKQNPQKHQAKNFRWKNTHPEEYAAMQAASYIRNKPTHQARHRAWTLANPDKRHASNHRRRARKSAVDCDLRVSLRDVIAIHGKNCYICDVVTDIHLPRHAPRKATLDHVISLANGGSHTIINLRCACHRCNCVKSSHRTADETRVILGIAAPATPFVSVAPLQSEPFSVPPLPRSPLSLTVA